MTITNTLIAGLDACVIERRRFVRALVKPDETAARRRLLRFYLPALRTFADGADPGELDDAILTLEDRLTRGLAYAGDKLDKADDLFVALLAEYETLSDARNLGRPAGDPLQPLLYLSDRIEARCRR